MRERGREKRPVCVSRGVIVLVSTMEKTKQTTKQKRVDGRNLWEGLQVKKGTKRRRGGWGGEEKETTGIFTG